VRGAGREWEAGTVTEVSPLKVKAGGYVAAFIWDEHRGTLYLSPQEDLPVLDNASGSILASSHQVIAGEPPAHRRAVGARGGCCDAATEPMRYKPRQLWAASS
jgi:hypothetical protein